MQVAHADTVVKAKRWARRGMSWVDNCLQLVKTQVRCKNIEYIEEQTTVKRASSQKGDYKIPKTAKIEN